jgi:septal ring factor EnvC (AmiA/AmiB activator)
MTPSQRLSLSLAGCLIVTAVVFAGIQWWSIPEPAPQPPSTRESAEDGPAPQRQARIERLQAEIDAQQRALREARQARSSATGELDRIRDDLSAVQDRVEELREQVDSRSQGQDAEASEDEGA